MSVSVAPFASYRLLSRRRQKAGGQQQVPKFHFVKTSRQPLREPRKRARGGNRTEIREPRVPKDMQDESRKPVSVTSCRPPGNAVRPEPAPASAPRGNGLQKDKRSLHASGLHPEREKPSEALFFPSFCTRKECLAAKKFRLCGRRFASLRKAMLFLPRKNTRREGEMLHTNSPSARFLTVRFWLRRSVLSLKHGNGRKAFLSGRKFRAWVTIRHGCCSRFPHRIPTEPFSA